VLPDPASAERYDDVYQRYRAVLASGLARVRTPEAAG
jgi:hypothetical protein